MDFNLLFPLIIGLSTWIYGTILLVKKLDSQITDEKIPNNLE